LHKIFSELISCSNLANLGIYSKLNKSTKALIPLSKSLRLKKLNNNYRGRGGGFILRGPALANLEALPKKKPQDFSWGHYDYLVWASFGNAYSFAKDK
jgi:hypothetical protein